MINKVETKQSFSGLLAPHNIFLGLRPNSRGRLCFFYRRLYHPFADESLQEINSNIRGLNVFENLRHVVGKKLPITQNEFWDIVAGKGKIKISYPEKDLMTEQKTIPERLYKLWTEA